MHRYQTFQRYVRLIMTFTAGLWLAAVPLLAQTNAGNIYGTVTDATGSPLPVVMTVGTTNSSCTFAS